MTFVDLATTENHLRGMQTPVWGRKPVWEQVRPANGVKTLAELAARRTVPRLFVPERYLPRPGNDVVHHNARFFPH